MIRFEQVSKAFGGRPVLDAVDFRVERGETAVIVGRSGAGKSVMLKHMVRLLTPDEGRVRIGEDEISAAPDRELERIRERFGMLFQGAALLQWMSVYDNVALPLRERTGESEAEIDGRVREALDLVGLGGDTEKMPADLSGGMRKRVGLARAIVRKPEIVLYDEPTSGLDPVTSRLIDGLIADMRAKVGVTNVVVTHDLHSALSIGTRIVMIHEGRIVEHSAPDEFIRSRHPEVRRFLESQHIRAEDPWLKEKISET